MKPTPPILFELREGLLVLRGHSLRLTVERGHFQVEDESFGVKRRARFSRIDRDLKRVVVLGPSGSISLDAIRWLHGVGVPLVHLHPDGTVYVAAVPEAAGVPSLKRAQALAAETGVGLRLAIDLLRDKLEGQVRVLELLPHGPAVQEARGGLLNALQGLDQARDLPSLRSVEGVGAKAYWRAWQGVPVRFATADGVRRPRHWQAFRTRVSPLHGGAGSPRKAVNPANAILNYLYAVLEAEARIAALAVGLDPMLGLLHADARSRDSLALDLMEPVRPAVDAWVLDLLTRRVFTKEDFFELETGQCRLMPAMTEALALTAPSWARLVLPVAQRVAAGLLASERPGVPKGSRPKRARGRVVRKFADLTSIQRGVVRDGRVSAGAGAKRRLAMRQVVAANRAAGNSPPSPAEAADYRARVWPLLRELPIKRIVDMTGLTKSACSRIRAGKVVPHRRHWASILA
jgi:CRISPR-associated endonuclease Cas1